MSGQFKRPYIVKPHESGDWAVGIASKKKDRKPVKLFGKKSDAIEWATQTAQFTRPGTIVTDRAGDYLRFEPADETIRTKYGLERPNDKIR